jgi:di/tricarboxylate transporter
LPAVLSALYVLAGTAVDVPDVTVGMLVVFAIILVGLVLFVTEILPIDLTAIGLLVAVVLLEPWTEVGVEGGLSGFASTATITVLAMFILSEGIRRTGLLQLIGDRIITLTQGKPKRQLAALVGLSGGTAGFINNTPVVAMMIPMVVNIAKKTNTSPSKYLIPVSFASMIGGMLTLIGTSTNLLASDVSARLLDQPFSMFEFTHLGVLLLVVGAAYLILIGWRLTPARIEPEDDPMETFEMAAYLTEVIVLQGSPLIGQSVVEATAQLDLDIEIVRMRREGETFTGPLGSKELRPSDVLLVRTDRETLVEIMGMQGLGVTTQREMKKQDIDAEEQGRALIEVVVLSETEVVGRTLDNAGLGAQAEATVLAIRRGSGIIHKSLQEVQLEGGDTLLVQASEDAVQRLSTDRNFIVTQEVDPPDFRSEKVPVALGIVAGVVVAAATGLMPIVVSSLIGVVLMVATGCLRPNEVYPAVDWNVIFLLAGVIPLGMALERTGGAEWLAQLTVFYAVDWPPVVLLFVFYLFTALITNVISNNASVVLMIPVAVSAAGLIDANAFAFVLAVTFASSTAMLTPVGYQTNLMVYGPGGYRFGDFFRVGALLQLLLAVVTAAGIWAFWGV